MKDQMSPKGQELHEMVNIFYHLVHASREAFYYFQLTDKENRPLAFRFH